MSAMNKKILRIALPSIISNITVPLLGLTDVTIVGHLGSSVYIGAIAVGGMLFNMVYWLFGFLRMGTGGLTSQAYGAGSRVEAVRILLRSLGVALAIGLLFILLQKPVSDIAFRLIEATPEVEQAAGLYFSILVWGAPAVLGLYSFAGWFLGMQDAHTPMAIAVAQNVVNIVVSVALVFGAGWKVEGVATGTLVAQYSGLLMAVLAWRIRYMRRLPRVSSRGIFERQALFRFFRVNRDIFLRTLCLVAVTTGFTSAGAACGDTVLAANALLMQFFVIFSYVMDGFAYAGEALGGRYAGAGDRTAFLGMAARLLRWCLVLALGFVVLYGCGGSLLLSFLTDEGSVLSEAHAYLPYVIVLPVLSFGAFLLDGLFIGTTSTREMLIGMSVAAVAFFVAFFLLRVRGGNHALWTAFLLYLFLRGAVQALFLRKIVQRIGGSGK